MPATHHTEAGSKCWPSQCSKCELQPSVTRCSKNAWVQCLPYNHYKSRLNLISYVFLDVLSYSTVGKLSFPSFCTRMREHPAKLCRYHVSRRHSQSGLFENYRSHDGKGSRHAANRLFKVSGKFNYRLRLWTCWWNIHFLFAFRN